MAGRTGDQAQSRGTGQLESTQSGRFGIARPQASFGGQDFYPDLIDKAAVLACHLAWNHALVDGNKRASWASLVMFLDLSGIVWHPDPPDVDEAEAAVLAVAAHVVDESWFAAWIRERTRAAES